MRNRTEEINVRVFKTEKNLIRRKARKCGMNMSEYQKMRGMSYQEVLRTNGQISFPEVLRQQNRL